VRLYYSTPFVLRSHSNGASERVFERDLRENQITPDLVLNRRAGRKQWTYSIDCKEIEYQLKARQSYEQQSGLASYSLGAAFWEVRASKG
jgi:hypothetical protein